MLGERAKHYFTVPYLEDRKGVTYDKLVRNDDWNMEWEEGKQRDYFTPQFDYTRNSNYEATLEKNRGKAGFGLNAGQWMIIFTLLYLNGDPATTKKMLLPLMIIALAPALMPAYMPEKFWTNRDKYFPKNQGITRTDNNLEANEDSANWHKSNWP